MTHAIIDFDSFDGYTCMTDVFSAINHAQLRYNWLIADWECYPEDEEIRDLFRGEYLWISGEGLTALIEREDFQWIWGILCGFEKNVSLENVLKTPLPFAQDYNGYYHNPVKMQHPLAAVEIVPCDSTYVLVLSKEKQIIDDYFRRCPEAKDLFIYNES